MDHSGDLSVGYIEGDGIGLELIPKVKTLVDEVVAHVYQQQKRINWVQLYLGEQGAQLCDGEWFPEQTLTQLRELKVALKGPMSSAVGGGFRSLNIALREELDLFATIREIKSLPGLPSPLANANGIDWVIIRECSEDSFASIELAAGTPDSAHLIDVLENELGYHQLRFVENCGLAIKNCSKEATERLLKCALTYAQKNHRKKITWVHKSNAWQLTEGQFQRWALDYLTEHYDCTEISSGRQYAFVDEHGTEYQFELMMLDEVMQRLAHQASSFDVMVCNNLAGDLLSDLAASLVGGVGVVPSVNCNDTMALFEPSHGPYKRIAGLGIANPSATIWAACLLLRHIDLTQASDALFSALCQVINANPEQFQLDTRKENASQLSSDAFIEKVKQAL